MPIGRQNATSHRRSDKIRPQHDFKFCARRSAVVVTVHNPAIATRPGLCAQGDVIAADGSLRGQFCPIKLAIPSGMNWIIPGNIKHFAFKTLPNRETSKYADLIT